MEAVLKIGFHSVVVWEVHLQGELSRKISLQRWIVEIHAVPCIRIRYFLRGVAVSRSVDDLNVLKRPSCILSSRSRARTFTRYEPLKTGNGYKLKN